MLQAAGLLFSGMYFLETASCWRKCPHAMCSAHAAADFREKMDAPVEVVVAVSSCVYSINEQLPSRRCHRGGIGCRARSRVRAMYPCVRAEVLACIIAAVGVAGRDAVITTTTASDPGVHCIPQRWLHQTLQERLCRA